MVRPAEGAELAKGAGLLASSLGFASADAVPAWLIHASVEAGGVALGAFEAGRLVGFSYAICGFDPDRHLFSCGLAVAPERRSAGIGRALKLAQREAARERGCATIRWTADPLVAPALRLYLSALGARLVGYRPEVYDGLRAPSTPPLDDVEIEWRLEGRPPDRARAEPRRPARPAARPLDVEIPFDRRTLDRTRLLAWRLRVREEMLAVLASGAVGTGVIVDRAAGRCWVRFGRPACSSA